MDKYREFNEFLPFLNNGTAARGQGQSKSLLMFALLSNCYSCYCVVVVVVRLQRELFKRKAVGFDRWSE